MNTSYFNHSTAGGKALYSKAQRVLQSTDITTVILQRNIIFIKH